MLSGLDEISAWDEVIALDPRLGDELDDDELDGALEALADFGDLKSPCRAGHSRGVAETAVAAGTALGMAPDDVRMLRRAALVHDVGMIGVPSAVWDEPQPWTLSQRERARTHPYLLERMLARTPMLSQIARCASLHHERLDGSGYPRGLPRRRDPAPGPHPRRRRRPPGARAAPARIATRSTRRRPPRSFATKSAPADSTAKSSTRCSAPAASACAGGPSSRAG